MTDFERQTQGYRLTTAEILYRCPDHLNVLQTYIWQDLDLAPQFPELKKFLDFWERKLDGPLHSVKVMCGEVIKPAEFSLVDADFHLH